jgi:isopropylmalate/homocitrate/citramalate synthase
MVTRVVPKVKVFDTTIKELLDLGNIDFDEVPQLVEMIAGTNIHGIGIPILPGIPASDYSSIMNECCQISYSQIIPMAFFENYDDAEQVLSSFFEDDFVNRKRTRQEVNSIAFTANDWKNDPDDVFRICRLIKSRGLKAYVYLISKDFKKDQGEIMDFARMVREREGVLTGKEIAKSLDIPNVIGISDATGLERPEFVTELVKAIKYEVGELEVFVRLHNNCGSGLATSLAAIDGGASGLSGTFNGIGSGFPVTPLEQILAVLFITYKGEIVMEPRKRPPGAIIPEKIKGLCKVIARMADIQVPANQPVIGKNVTIHATSIHRMAAARTAAGYIVAGIDMFGIDKRTGSIYGLRSGKGDAVRLLKKNGVEYSKQDIDDLTLLIKHMGSLKTFKSRDVMKLYKELDRGRQSIEKLEQKLDLVNYKELKDYNPRSIPELVMFLRANDKLEKKERMKLTAGRAKEDGRKPLTDRQKELLDWFASFYSKK